MISYFFSHNQENSQSPLWWGQLVSQWAGLQSECLRRQRKKKNDLLGSSPCLFRAEKQEYYRSVTWYCGRERYVSFCSYVPYVLLLIASVFLRLPYESSKTGDLRLPKLTVHFQGFRLFLTPCQSRQQRSALVFSQIYRLNQYSQGWFLSELIWN